MGDSGDRKLRAVSMVLGAMVQPKRTKEETTMRKLYCWVAMEKGKLMKGMYTRSDLASTPEVARQLAKPSEGDAYALCEVTMNQGNYIDSEVIQEIVTK